MLMDEEFVAVFPSLVRRLCDPGRAIVLQTLWFRADKQTGEVVMTHRDISDRTGIPERTVRRATNWLRNEGFLSSRRLSSENPTQVWRVNKEALDPYIALVRRGLGAHHRWIDGDQS